MGADQEQAPWKTVAVEEAARRAAEDEAAAPWKRSGPTKGLGEMRILAHWKERGWQNGNGNGVEKKITLLTSSTLYNDTFLY